LHHLSGNNKIIVVGGNAAGPAAAAKAKRIAPDLNIIMIEAGNYISTGTCEIPYVLSGEIKNNSGILFHSPESFEKEKKVKVLTGHLVEKIDRIKKMIAVKNLLNGQIFELDYDRLILCTGSNAKKIPGLFPRLSNIFSLKTVDDLNSITEFIKKSKPRRGLIVGAGYIGLETADALTTLGIEITLLEKESLPLPNGETESSRLILALINEMGVDFIGSAEKVAFNQDGKRLSGIRFEGRFMEFDFAVIAAGFEPNNALAIASKLHIGKLGGIAVDQKLKTSDPNIYAAGDCIEIINSVNGKPDYFPLAKVAFRSGNLAGANAAGGNYVIKPVIKNIAVKIFDRAFVQVGLNSAEAVESCFRFSAISAVAPNLVKVMPGSINTFAKILFDINTKQILGANFFGGSEVIGYGDLISVFIQKGLKVNELSNLEMNYTPPLSPFNNILSILGRKIERGIL
jgi:CoA-dependent NAD(P)H sulfur oxidoreductase